MNALVRVDKVSKQYDSLLAIEDISFELHAGQVLGLLGHNGAGKSTLISSLLGGQTYQGEIEVCGLNPIKQRAELMTHLAYISDVNVLPGWMSVAQILRYTAGVHPSFDLEKATNLLDRTQIAESSKIASLSKGMKVQLHLAIIIATDSKVLILDEPTLGLDLIYRDTFYRHLIEWFHDGERALIIASHEVNEIEHLLTDVVMLKQGKTVLQANMDVLHDQYFQLDATHQQQALIEKMSPVSSQLGLAGRKWLLKSQYRAEAEGLGEISNPSLQDIFIALQKENV